jgi:hypothetical protein
MTSLRFSQSNADGAVSITVSSRGTALNETLADWELDDLILQLQSYRGFAEAARLEGVPDRTGRYKCEGCGGALVTYSRGEMFRHYNPYDSAACELSFPVPVDYQETLESLGDDSPDSTLDKFIADTEEENGK